MLLSLDLKPAGVVKKKVAQNRSESLREHFGSGKSQTCNQNTIRLQAWDEK